MNRRPIRTFATATILLSALIVSELRANQHTFGVSGVVTSVDSPLGSQFAVGDTLQGTYTFDDADVDTYAPPDLGFYENPFISATVPFSNGYSATYNSLATSKLILVDNAGNPDLYEVFIPVNGPIVSGMSAQLFEFYLQDNQGAMLASDDLPTSPPNFALAESAKGFLRFGNEQSQRFVYFDLVSLVPEPSTATLLGVIAALLLPMRRRFTG